MAYFHFIGQVRADTQVCPYGYATSFSCTRE